MRKTWVNSLPVTCPRRTTLLQGEEKLIHIRNSDPHVRRKKKRINELQ